MRRTVRMDLSADLQENVIARRIARAALELDHADAEQIDDAVLVTSELFTNAVKATSDDAAVSVSVVLSDADIRVSVSNRGPAFDVRRERSRPSDVGGRGLELAGELGETTMTHDEGITTVSVDIPIGPHASPPDHWT